MSERAETVEPDDVLDVVAMAVETLRAARDRDWSVPAGDLEWDCWETVEHLADDLFFYAAQLAVDTGDHYLPAEAAARRPGGVVNTIRAEPAAGVDGLLEVLTACGGLLAAMVRVTPPTVRAHHVHGPADPEASAAMGLLETLVHVHDVARGLGLPWQPPEPVCAAVLARLMPDVAIEGSAFTTLLWACGRSTADGRPRRTTWRWYNDRSTVH